MLFYFCEMMGAFNVIHWPSQSFQVSNMTKYILKCMLVFYIIHWAVELLQVSHKFDNFSVLMRMKDIINRSHQILGS